MADIRPFRAFRYDPQRVSPDQAVTQPYDKITPALQERYYAASPYNLVRIILGRRQPEDNRADNVYSRAALSLAEWRREGILRQTPASRRPAEGNPLLCFRASFLKSRQETVRAGKSQRAK